MNLADGRDPSDCVEGTRRKAEWWAWKQRKFAQTAMQEYYAHRAYRQHVDECAICKEEEE